MKLIFVNRFFYPDESATSRVVSSLAFGVAAEGHEVTALCGRSACIGANHAGRHLVHGVDIVRLSSAKHSRGGLLRRAAGDLRFHLETAFWLIRNVRRGDICVVCTDPPLHSVSAAPAIALRGGVMVNWMMDLFPEVAIELDVIRRGGLAARTLLALRDLSLRAASLTVCPGDAMARRLAARGHSEDRLAVVRHWSDGDEIAPVEPGRNALRREWGYGGELVIGYSGNFGRAHDFTTLIGAAERLRDETDIRFLLIGGGARRNEVERAIRQRGLANVAFKPLQPRERLAESMSVADVHVVSLLPDLESCIVPSKFYGVLAAGRPTLFVGAPNGEVARVAASAGCGVHVAIGDIDGLVRRIRELRADPQARIEMGRRARRLFLAEYGRHRGVGEWCSLIDVLGAAAIPQFQPAQAQEAGK